ncbi:MAG: anti-sigma factor [Acidimicrobiia bacterium]|nr:anti-sigma factor [Acidimicrobiia bacterium]
MSDPHAHGPSDDDMMFNGAGTIAGLLAEITDADRHRLEPPPSIWNAIFATVSADSDGRPDRSLTLTDNGDGSVIADITSIERQATTTIALAARRRATDQPSLPPEMSAWRRQWLPVAAAVAVTIVGGLVTWAFSDELAEDNSTTATLEGEVVATTGVTDEGLSDGASGVAEIGEARLVRSGDRYYLDIDLDGDVTDLPSIEGYYELWIVDPEIDGAISLGVMAGDGRYALPDNLDPADFPVVDVSVESVDGDPTHSGRSAWRGHLDL